MQKLRLGESPPSNAQPLCGHMRESKCKANVPGTARIQGLPVLAESLRNKGHVVNSGSQSPVFSREEPKQRAGTSLPPRITHGIKRGRILAIPKDVKVKG